METRQPGRRCKVDFTRFANSYKYCCVSVSRRLVYLIRYQGKPSLRWHLPDISY